MHCIANTVYYLLFDVWQISIRGVIFHSLKEHQTYKLLLLIVWLAGMGRMISELRVRKDRRCRQGCQFCWPRPTHKKATASDITGSHEDLESQPGLNVPRYLSLQYNLATVIRVAEAATLT